MWSSNISKLGVSIRIFETKMTLEVKVLCISLISWGHLREEGREYTRSNISVKFSFLFFTGLISRNFRLILKFDFQVTLKVKKKVKSRVTVRYTKKKFYNFSTSFGNSFLKFFTLFSIMMAFCTVTMNIVLWTDFESIVYSFLANSILYLYNFLTQ